MAASHEIGTPISSGDMTTSKSMSYATSLLEPALEANMDKAYHASAIASGSMGHLTSLMATASISDMASAMSTPALVVPDTEDSERPSQASALTASAMIVTATFENSGDMKELTRSAATKTSDMESSDMDDFISATPIATGELGMAVNGVGRAGKLASTSQLIAAIASSSSTPERQRKLKQGKFQ